ncbi:MAG: NAD-dependent epimerase/dehydratase family protein [Solobacterium sp.]|nr:NAD-dependent epimerase/dehydratase family protein [Solobacterium sp.]MBR0479198.1 NAD-dependent epimerase/dehydratase family protein [Solobacterium sp.]
MNIVILGCGYLGYNLASALQDKHQVTALGWKSPYREGKFRYEERDCFQRGFTQGLPLEGAVVIDAVGLIGNRDSGDEASALAVLREKYRVLFDELAERKIDRFIFFSSGGTVYGSNPEPVSEDSPLQPGSLYARSKVMLEEMIPECRFPGLILRLSNPYGGKQDPHKSQGVIPILIRKALKNELFEMYSRPGSVRDYFYIDDLCRAVEVLLEKDIKEGILNVGSGEGTALSELIRLCEEATGRRIRIEYHDPGENALDTNILDVRRIRELIGWQAETELREGIRRETERIRKEEEQ